ncbi:M24 family metallopeptidase, partial [Staphylococcus warneri]|uniref:M24 family metallopeptidase n=1 Tax=Staphylococcus warneri TaxID=1292 RepID=UPI0011AA404C
YCSDITTTFPIAQPNPKIKQIYHILLKPQQKPLNQIKPPITLKQPHPLSPHFIQPHPYPHQFPHSLAHPIRLHIHQRPLLSKNAS